MAGKFAAESPHHPSMRLHALPEDCRGCTVSINLSFRITLELLIQDEEIIPINVGIMMLRMDDWSY